jgi:hypothetical protein
MRIVICDGENCFDDQTHAYAEYRVFSSLAGETTSIRTVLVTLAGARGAAPAPPEGGRAACSVAVTTTGGRRAEVRAVAAHPYAAIDRAAGLIRRALRRHRDVRAPEPAVVWDPETA